MNLSFLMSDLCNPEEDDFGRTEAAAIQYFTPEGIGKAVSYFLKTLAGSADERWNIHFTGDEAFTDPETVLESLPVIRERLSGRQAAFYLKTNGTRLTHEILDRLMHEKVKVIVSLERGREGCFKGSGNKRSPISSHPVEPFLEHLGRDEAEIVRWITPDNYTFLREDLEELACFDFPRLLAKVDFHSGWSGEDLKGLKEVYRSTASWVSAYRKTHPGFSLSLFSEKLSGEVSDISCAYAPCPMGKSQFAVTPDGRIYPCWNLAGSNLRREVCIGHIGKGFWIPTHGQVVRRAFAERLECASCPVRKRCMADICSCLRYQSSGSLEGFSLWVCEHERMLCQVADEFEEGLS